MKHLQTCIPNHDKNKLFLGQPLKEITSLKEIYNFTYPEIMSHAKTVDVIWFNERRLPSAFFEIEHSTNIEHSLVKFYELQDFSATLHIVAEGYRQKQFAKLMEKSIFRPLKKQVKFVTYDKIVNQYTQMCRLPSVDTI
ncbi:MAG: hypothetical protein LBH73_01960 [Spirochaetaceae bacterium]|jgi:hypothetical protein|nr:hypothetical protein [Spirochaetaceae bacterium]